MRWQVDKNAPPDIQPSKDKSLKTAPEDKMKISITGFSITVSAATVLIIGCAQPRDFSRFLAAEIGAFGGRTNELTTTEELYGHWTVARDDSALRSIPRHRFHGCHQLPFKSVWNTSILHRGERTAWSNLCLFAGICWDYDFRKHYEIRCRGYTDKI